jgi:hypothetical protein
MQYQKLTSTLSKQQRVCQQIPLDCWLSKIPEATLLFSGKNYWVRPEKIEKKFSLAKNTLSRPSTF